MQPQRTEIDLNPALYAPASYPRTPTALFNDKGTNILFDVDM